MICASAPSASITSPAIIASDFLMGVSASQSLTWVSGLGSRVLGLAVQSYTQHVKQQVPQPKMNDPRITEQRNPRTSDIDLASSLDIVDIIAAEDRRVPDAVFSQREAL